MCVLAVRMSLFTPAASLLDHGTVTDCLIAVCRVCVFVCVSRPGVRQVQHFLAGPRTEGRDDGSHCRM